MRICSAIAPALTHAERQAQYRKRQGDNGRANNAARMRKTRAASVPYFVGVDSEGIGRGANHHAVLLGVGKEQYLAKDMDRGLDWPETFGFLYGQYRQRPAAAYVGFYLGYDFNHWLRYLPLNSAWLLLSKEGRAMRKMRKEGRSTTYRREYHPVRVEGWEIDMLGFKRLSIRPRPDGCNCHERKIKCTHDYEPWMHICDAGAFFQMSFVNVLDPDKWKDDPRGPICSVEEYNRIKVNKDKRAFFTHVDDEMKYYNALENELLARCMDRLARGFNEVGIRLGKDQWYGPGASASKWLGQHEAPKRVKLTQDQGKTKRLMPDWAWDAFRRSYYGGWFEIFSHGLILGSSWNYDINNAYPYATTKLPHICEEGKWTRGGGDYTGDNPYVLLYATVYGSSTRIGPVPYRRKDGSILRPSISKGWYWRTEIDAARRAGLVKKVTVYEHVAYEQCGHKEPFTDVRVLYDKRLSVGKDSAQGMAIKLNNNSLYGKFAQSVGGAPYSNWFYASYITSHCRTQILDAIASHPRQANGVLMVATDGVCFDERHPSLPVSKALGEWAETEYHELSLFKPGVYWHKEGKERLLKLKSRGVPRKEFQKQIEQIDRQFRAWHTHGFFPGTKIDSALLDPSEAEFGVYWQWPGMEIPVNFRMKTCKQAIIEGKWGSACEVQENAVIWQDSDPHLKRRRAVWNEERHRLDTSNYDLPIKELETTYYGEEERRIPKSMGFSFDGDPMIPALDLVQLIRDKKANYDIDFTGDIEWENVWGG